MEKIIKSLLLTIAFLFLFGVDENKVSAKEISITTENFPEEWLRNLLATTEYDKNGDGVLSEEELKDITNVECVFEEKQEINGAEGIEHLPYLESIFLENIKSNNLQLIHCPSKLKHVGIWSAEIKKLKIFSKHIETIRMPTADQLEYWSESQPCVVERIDVSGCKKLETLHCEMTGVLSKLNVRGCSNLIRLRCSSGKLTKLDVSQNKRLRFLRCNNNQLKELNFSSNKRLTYLECSRNKLKKLNVYQNKKLTVIECKKNCLTSLDLSQNKKLEWVTFRNNKIKTLKLPDSEFLRGSGVEGDDPEVDPEVYTSFVRNPIRVVDITAVKKLKKLSYDDVLKFLSGGYCQVDEVYPSAYDPDRYHLDVKERPIKKLIVSKKMNAKDKKWIQKIAGEYKVKVVYR